MTAGSERRNEAQPAGAQTSGAQTTGAQATGARATGEQVDALIVFIAGDAPSSRQAMANLTGVLDALGIPPERLQVIDVLTDPGAALEAGALVTPSLRIERGQRARWFLGDLSEQRDLLAFLS